MGLKHLEDVTYFRLNNEINRPVNGQIMLHKDKEALDAFFKENVVPNTMFFDSIKDKINYLIEHNYIETAFIKKYRPEFLEELSQFIKDQNFQFKSFMAAYKFYNQYALKTNDGEYYLESMEDRVFFNALYFADGNEAVAIDIANEIIHQRYQPATPSFLNAGRARREGYRVDSVPTIGSIAWSTAGGYGHVAWVSNVMGDNIEIEEYNYGYTGSYNKRIIKANTMTGFIHFKDLDGGNVVSSSNVFNSQPSSSTGGTHYFKNKAPIKNQPLASAASIAYYSPGESVHYDQVLEKDGYKWLSYISYREVVVIFS